MHVTTRKDSSPPNDRMLIPKKNRKEVYKYLFKGGRCSRETPLAGSAERVHSLVFDLEIHVLCYSLALTSVKLC